MAFKKAASRNPRANRHDDTPPPCNIRRTIAAALFIILEAVQSIDDSRDGASAKQGHPEVHRCYQTRILPALDNVKPLIPSAIKITLTGHEDYQGAHPQKRGRAASFSCQRSGRRSARSLAPPPENARRRTPQCPATGGQQPSSKAVGQHRGHDSQPGWPSQQVRSLI